MARVGDRRLTQMRTSRGRGLAAGLAFTDDAEAVGLRFVYDNAETALHQLPEPFGGGLALLDYDGDGWLDVYCVQGGPFAASSDSDRSRQAPPGIACSTIEATAPSRTSPTARGSAGFPADTATAWPWATSTATATPMCSSPVGDRMPCIATGATAPSRTSPTRGDWVAAEIGRPRRRWPTWTATATSTSTSATTRPGTSTTPGSAATRRRKPISTATRSMPRPCPTTFSAMTGGGSWMSRPSPGIVDRDGRGLGVVAADLDDDGRVDLFVANDSSANFLFRNLGGMRFEEVGHAAGVAGNASGSYQAGMGVAAGDLDGDGLIDLAVTNFYGESTTFYRNLGGGVFTDATASIGLAVASRRLLGFGVALLDADNDGRLDLASANGHVNDLRPNYPYLMPAQLLLGGRDGRLTDVSDRAGDPWQVPRMGRGLAVGDLDNDGRQDVLILSHNQPLAYFHNRTEGGRFLTLRLEGRQSNRDVVGAKVAVVSGGRRRVAWRIGGGSYQSASDPRLHFGLGRSAESRPSRSPGHRDALTATVGYGPIPATCCAREMISRNRWRDSGPSVRDPE